jgi:hypothetical protein
MHAGTDQKRHLMAGAKQIWLVADLGDVGVVSPGDVNLRRFFRECGGSHQ